MTTIISKLELIRMINAEIKKYADENYYDTLESETANNQIHAIVEDHFFEWENDDEYVEYCLKATPVECLEFLKQKINNLIK